MDRWQRTQRAAGGADTTSEDRSKDGRVALLLPPHDPSRIRPWDGRVDKH